MKTVEQSKPKPQVGQKLFAKIWQGRSVPYAKRWLEVSQVGRKYFECTDPEWKGRRPRKFLVSSWGLADMNESVNLPVHLYSSEAECGEDEQAEGLAIGLSLRIRYPGDWRKLNLSQLNRITDILNETTDVL